MKNEHYKDYYMFSLTLSLSLTVFFRAAALSSLAFVVIHTSVMLVELEVQDPPSNMWQYALTYGTVPFACFLTLGESLAREREGEKNCKLLYGPSSPLPLAAKKKRKNNKNVLTTSDELFFLFFPFLLLFLSFSETLRHPVTLLLALVAGNLFTDGCVVVLPLLSIFAGVSMYYASTAFLDKASR